MADYNFGYEIWDFGRAVYDPTSQIQNEEAYITPIYFDIHSA